MRLQIFTGAASALACVLLSSCAEFPNRETPIGSVPAGVAPTLDARQIAVLNGLRDEINLNYGFRDAVPRVNLGPCGRFARDFREQWNARFPQQIHIVFVMSPDGKECYHVLVRLPDGNYFDGGNGVISGPALLKGYQPGTRLDEMAQFDWKLLDKWSYGLGRSYELCPNYSDELTAQIIEKHLIQMQTHREASK